jgi:hypothetical protein
MEIECTKDTAKLLALVFTTKLNLALKRIISYERDKNGKLLSDGSIAINKKENTAEGEGGEGSTSTFYAILDRTAWLSNENILELNVPICVFITGNLAFYTTVVGKEGMDKAHCH